MILYISLSHQNVRALKALLFIWTVCLTGSGHIVGVYFNIFINCFCAIKQKGCFKDSLQKTLIKLQKCVWDWCTDSLAPEATGHTFQ
jgi:hypothetical protein